MQAKRETTERKRYDVSFSPKFEMFKDILASVIGLGPGFNADNKTPAIPFRHCDQFSTLIHTQVGVYGWPMSGIRSSHLEDLDQIHLASFQHNDALKDDGEQAAMHTHM
jgi:hypothetical protein